MKMPKGCIKTLIFACCVSLFIANGWSQGYPAKSIRLVVGTSAGGGGDIIGRLMAGGMAPILGQQVIVDNRPGGGSNIAAEIVARSAADGYTLFGITITHALNVSLYRDLKFDLLKDFAAITNLASSPQVVVVHPSLPVNTIGELIKMAKARPGSINYCSAGAGTSSFLAAELFKAQAGVNLVHVPYRGGGAALAAVVSGESQVQFAPVAGALPFIQQGRMHALAVTSTQRVALVSGLPTVAESGLPGYESGNWYGLMVPARTPKQTITAIRNTAVAVLNKPDVNKRLADLGYVVIGDSPEQFAAYIKSEIVKLANVVREQHLTPD